MKMQYHIARLHLQLRNDTSLNGLANTVRVGLNTASDGLMAAPRWSAHVNATVACMAK